MTITTKAYEVERRQLLRWRAGVAAVLGMVLVPLFGITDYFHYRSLFAPLMSVRLASCAISAAVLLLLRGRLGIRRPSWLAVILILQCGLTIAGIPVYFTGTADTPHYVSMALLILSSSAMLPWTAAQVMLVSAALTAMFLTAGLLNGPVRDMVAFQTQVSAILITGVIGVVISTLSEQARAREFAARRALRTASREKTRLIQHLEEMAARLATANEDLQERQRETDDFLYVLSHDLRAPLINLQGFGKRLQTDMASLEAGVEDISTAGPLLKLLGRMKQSLQFINVGTAKIDQLISRLLDIARLTTRPGYHEWIDTSAMVRDVIDACRFQIDAGGVEVSVGELPPVYGDPVQLNQVFTNLVDNAIKYMGAGPRKQIRITCDAHGDRYRFSVRDSGPGIAPKDQEKVFRLFARAAPNDSTGEGVGLATVRAIVNRHGGRIWVESILGEGSTFHFTLPQNAAGARLAAAPTAAAEIATRPMREEYAAHVD